MLSQIARHSISSPALHKLLATLNKGLPYVEQIKPFNFLSIAFVHPLERPPDEPRLVLIAPYRNDPAKHLEQTWVNRYTGKTYKITTEPSQARHRPGLLTVKTYRNVLAEYAMHPEAKSNGPDGEPCSPQTVGMLSRRPFTARTIVHIGKEANRLEEAQAGLLQRIEESLALRRFDPRTAGVGAPDPAQTRRPRGRKRTGHSLGAVHAVLRKGAKPHTDALRRYLDIAKSTSS